MISTIITRLHKRVAAISPGWFSVSEQGNKLGLRDGFTETFELSDSNSGSYEVLNLSHKDRT